MKTRILILSGFLFLSFVAGAQSYNNLSGQNSGNRVITTAVPFLMIGPDGRAGGLGDGGVATSPDINSMHWNAAKYAFIENSSGFSISYTPWLRNLVNDINLAYVSYFHRLDDQSAIATTLRYFSLGEIQFTEEPPPGSNEPLVLGTYKPNEFAFDAAYARKLSPNLSLAVTGRFIYSNLTAGFVSQGVESTAGVSVAVDVSLYWQKDITLSNMDGELALGLNISNIGRKISYNKTNIEKDFIPTNFRFGPRLTLDLDSYNKISFNIDINKLLVPTPPIYTDSLVGGSYLIEKGKDPNVAVVRGMVQSWYDAPDGFKEELQEFYFSAGIEYWYNDIFALRAGYFYENAHKGDRQYVTVGVGLRYHVFGLDFSYLIPTVSQQNPLEKTLRFSLLFNFGNNSTGRKY